MYCYSKSDDGFPNNLILNFGDIITFEESNYKITTISDLEKFRREIEV